MNLKDEIKEIRRRRGINPSDFEMVTGLDYRATKTKADEGQLNANKIIEYAEQIFVPKGLKIFCEIVLRISEDISEKFIEFLDPELKAQESIDLNKVFIKFEIYAYTIFLVDAFANEYQTYETRTEIFYTLSNETLKSLQKLLPEYQEKKFNDDLHERMIGYGEYIKEKDSIFELPREVKTWYLLQENLTKAAKFPANEFGHSDSVALAWGIAHETVEENLRSFIINLFSSNEDICNLGIDEIENLIKKDIWKIKN